MRALPWSLLIPGTPLSLTSPQALNAAVLLQGIDAYMRHVLNDRHVPVATWMQHAQVDVPVAGGKRVRSAATDSDGVLPDVDRTSNTFTADAATSH